MTPEQIRERCHAVLASLHIIKTGTDMLDQYKIENDRCTLETLYHEAMAKGLEMAGDRWHVLLDQENESTDDQAWEFTDWCYTEATKLKGDQ